MSAREEFSEEFSEEISLTPEHLIGAYCTGAFPMADPKTGAIRFFECAPRCIMPLEEGGMRVSRSLARRVRSGRFRITWNRAFSEVIAGCAQDRSESNPSWISPELIACNERLHMDGIAHSVEAWRDGRLVGGLYGIAIGAAFFGESMFSRPRDGGTDASKVCLVELVTRLRAHRFTLLDCQFSNPHTESLGAIEIRRKDYHARLEVAIRTWSDRLPMS